jgi:hypothetical protein
MPRKARIDAPGALQRGEKLALGNKYSLADKMKNVIIT